MAACIFSSGTPAPPPRCDPDPPLHRGQVKEHHDQAVIAQIFWLCNHDGLRPIADKNTRANPLTVASLSGVALSTLSKSKVSIFCCLPFSDAEIAFALDPQSARRSSRRAPPRWSAPASPFIFKTKPPAEWTRLRARWCAESWASSGCAPGKRERQRRNPRRSSAIDPSFFIPHGPGAPGPDSGTGDGLNSKFEITWLQT